MVGNVTSSFYGTTTSLFQHPSVGKGGEMEVPDFKTKKEIEKVVIFRHKTCNLEQGNHYPGTYCLKAPPPPPRMIYQVQKQVVMANRKNNGLNMYIICHCQIYLMSVARVWHP